MDDKAWIPAGVMAIPRKEKVENAIFANQVNFDRETFRIFKIIRKFFRKP